MASSLEIRTRAGCACTTPVGQLLATANSTLNSVDNISLSGLRALVSSNTTPQVALIDFTGTIPQVTRFDPQMGSGSCISIKGTIGCCGAILGTNVKLFDLTANPPRPIGNVVTSETAITSLDMGIVSPVTPEPKLAVTPAGLGFGWVPVGTSATLPLSFRNTGGGTLSVSNLIAPNRFQLTSTAPLSLEPGATASRNVTFSPDAERVFAGTITMNSNDPSRPTAQVPVSGGGGQAGQLWHTIRNPDGSWQPSFVLIESQEQNNPGTFSRVGCAGVGDQLQVIGITFGQLHNGQLWHTIRDPDGSWQPSFGLIESQEQNNPGVFSAVGCAGIGDQLQVVGIVNGQLWNTIRKPDGSWQPSFGLIESQEQNNPGVVSEVSCAGVGDQLQVVGIVPDPSQQA